ncbi:hypothetical protein ACP4OV_021056 [Aristida adscensionis]
MTGAAAVLVRSVAGRGKTPMLLGARSLLRQQPQPQAAAAAAAAAVLSPRLFSHGGHCVPLATSARFISSSSAGSPNKNPSTSRTKPAGGVDALANEQKLMACRDNIKNKEQLESCLNKPEVLKLKRQIEVKQVELLQMLLQMQMYAKHNASFSESEKCLQEKEELLRLLREFQAKTHCNETKKTSDCIFLCFLVALLALGCLATEINSDDTQIEALPFSYDKLP